MCYLLNGHKIRVLKNITISSGCELENITTKNGVKLLVCRGFNDINGNARYDVIMRNPFFSSFFNVCFRTYLDKETLSNSIIEIKD